MSLHAQFMDGCVSPALFALFLVHLTTLPIALHQVETVTVLFLKPKWQPAPFPAVIYKAVGRGAAAEMACHSLGEGSGRGTGAASFPCRAEIAGFQLELQRGKAHVA